MIRMRRSPRAKLPVTFVQNVAQGKVPLATWISWATSYLAGAPNAPPAATAATTSAGAGPVFHLGRNPAPLPCDIAPPP